MSPSQSALPQPARRLALLVEYDGTNYLGFQLQKGQPTIQGALEQALRQFTRESIRIRAASRTDSGAHAQGQVVDFLTTSSHPAETFPRALNFYLPDDIRVQGAYEVAPGFHSRKDALSRTYRYTIVNRQWPSPLRRTSAHWVREPLSIERMRAAARCLVGTHEFRPFAGSYPSGVSTVRTIYQWDIKAEDDTIEIVCEANGFLRHQIRRVNGLLTEIGKGKLESSLLQEILEGRTTEDLEWPSLPAHGLCLVKVTYPNFWSQVKVKNETD